MSELWRDKSGEDARLGRRFSEAHPCVRVHVLASRFLELPRRALRLSCARALRKRLGSSFTGAERDLVSARQRGTERDHVCGRGLLTAALRDLFAEGGPLFHFVSFSFHVTSFAKEILPK